MNGFHNPPGEGPTRQFPHIQDLQAQASQEISKLTVYSSLDVLLTASLQCNKQVSTDVSFKRPHRAYAEWLKSEEILKLIQRHQEFPYIQSQKKEKYSSCARDHERQKPMQAELKRMIEENNANSGVLPTQNGVGDFVSLSSQTQGGRPVSMQKASEPQNNPFNRPTSQQSEVRPQSQASSTSQHSSRTNGTSAHDVDPLVARFSQLRPSSGPRFPLPYPENDDSFRFPASSPAPNEKGDLSHLSSTKSTPAGPRQMPGVQPSGPAIPPKKPLAPPVITSLPRAPSPVYSPARNIGAPASIEPPRVSSRSSGPTYRPMPPSTNGYQLPPQNYTLRDNRPATMPAPTSERPPLPSLSVIRPSDLHQYNRQGYSILLLDVRSRDFFDEGHIGFSSVICIDPFDIKAGIPFDQLIETLPFASSEDLERLRRIGRYDLVVIYDDNTPNDSFIHGSPSSSSVPHMRTLYDTLTIFNYNAATKLRHPPAVLEGGVYGWVDFLGPQSLVSSDTSGVPQSERLPKPARRPARRISAADEGSSREIRRRRLENFTPMRPEEEREWKEKLQREQLAPADIRQYVDENNQSESRDSGETQLLHSYDDFFRRFPPVEQQSMISAPRHGPPPRAPAPLPAAPSRPAPAVSRPSYSGVTDREATQPSANRQVAQQPPLYTSRFMAQSLRLPHTGLKNFGSTCYMNATIQCLQATIALSRFFLDDSWRTWIQKNRLGSGGLFPETYANLIRGLWRDEDKTIRPITMRKFCGRMKPEWGNDDQQDAQEFLGWLIDLLHEDLNSRHMNKPLKPLTEEEEAIREVMPIAKVSRIEWDRWSYRAYSFLSTLFAGQHASRVQCKACNATSTTYESFWMINLEIPRSGQPVDIYACLQNYCKQEELTDPWTCPKCKQLRPATKQIRITRMPQILIINFKRFNFAYQATKIQTPIEFPIYGLNMERFMWNTYQPPKNGEGIDHAITGPFFYDLYAVMRHLGTTVKSGHYTAVVKDSARDQWRNFNDDLVENYNPASAAGGARLQSQEAYLVFYERAKAR